MSRSHWQKGFFGDEERELKARHDWKRRRWLTAGLLGAGMVLCGGESGAQTTAKAATQEQQAVLQEAVGWVRSEPKLQVGYEYVMTAKIRLLFFWVAKDDVGGGYVRRGTAETDPQLETFQLLFGSEPAKARGINRWGAAKEVVRRGSNGSGEIESSAFFGFMKASKGSSVSEMEKELSKEGQSGGHLFEAILNRVGREGGVSKVVPFYSQQDFNLHEMEKAQQVVFDRLANEAGRVRQVDALASSACGKANGFLSSVAELVDAALEGRKVPFETCYFYHGERFTMKVVGTETIREKKISVSLKGQEKPLERTYRDLLRTEFRIDNHMTGKVTRFELLLGTKENLRGTPVQIDYQPNWWFRVVLNLQAKNGAEAKKAE